MLVDYLIKSGHKLNFRLVLQGCVSHEYVVHGRRIEVGNESFPATDIGRLLKVSKIFFDRRAIHCGITRIRSKCL